MSPKRDGNLPAEITTFVGRDQLLANTGNLLTDDQVRLVTLTGTSGVGKTRVALKIGERMLSQGTYRHGVWLVTLAGLQDPALLDRTVSEALAIVDNAGDQSGLGRLTEALRYKHALLILDNCEHLLEAVQRLVRSLLLGCGDLTVLTTSQERLNVAGEHVIKVPPMCVADEEDDDSPFPTGELHEAVRLFIDRATAVGAEFTEHDCPMMADLCRLLDGLPLAIELAAVRLGEVSLTEIYEQLGGEGDGRFALLIDGDPEAKVSHRTLWRALEWSAGLCSPAERLLWQAISVFPAAFDRDAAMAVCAKHGIDHDQVLGLLTGLVRKSILIKEASTTTRLTRYRMLDSVRQFGAHLLDAERRSVLRREHADYFQALLQKAAQDWLGPREVWWMRRLHEEWPNIRAAILYNLSQPDRVEMGAEMAIDCGRTRFTVFGGFMGQNRKIMEQAYEALGSRPHPMVLGTAVYCASFGIMQGDPDFAAPWLNRARTAADRLGVRDVAAPLRYVEGAHTLWNAREREQGRPSIAQLAWAAELSRQDGSPGGDTYMMDLFTAIAADLHGDRDTAAAVVNKLVANAEAHRGEWTISWALWVRGLFELIHTGNLHEAYRLGQQALGMQLAMHDTWGPAWSLWLLGCVAARLKLFDLAAQLFGGAQRQRQVCSTALEGLAPLIPLNEQAQDLARRGLGAEKFTAQVAVAAGMRLEQIGEIALQELPDAADMRVARGESLLPGGLTEREMEIAELVAEGLTNRDIGTRLFISPRTVDAHVARIRDRLGLSNKAQLGAWYRQHTASDSAEDPATRAS